MREEFTTTDIQRKDLEFFRRLKKKKRLVSMWAVWERLHKLVLDHKLEDEL